MKQGFSANIEPEMLDKLDMIAIQDDRSRSYLLQIAIDNYIKRFEKNNGELDIDQAALKKFRHRNRKYTQ